MNNDLEKLYNNKENDDIITPEGEESSTNIDELVSINNNLFDEKPYTPKDEEGELVYNYIGPNYKKIASRPYNFAALFFTQYYLFYRKSLIVGLLLHTLYIYLSTIMSEIILFIGFHLFFGLGFNTLYLYFTKVKIAIIQEKYKDSSFEEQVRISKESGGTSIITLLLGIIISLVITIGIYKVTNYNIINTINKIKMIIKR